MSLYPSLEDMMVHTSGAVMEPSPAAGVPVAQPTAAVAVTSQVTGLPSYPSLYPSLTDMGLELSSDVLEEHSLALAQINSSMQSVAPAHTRPAACANQSMVAPVTGVNDRGLMQAQIKQGLRPIVLCKDTNGKVGLSVAAISKGIFVAFVYKDSPAAKAGLRFGDQILQVNSTTLAGFKIPAVEKLIKKAAPERIEIVVRDRPFERTLTLQKDSLNHVGFTFKKGLISSIVKDSSAARNGMVTDHYLVELNGQNIVGLSDDDISSLFAAAPPSVTVTIMPNFLYNHLIKHIGNMRKYMDRSVPEF